MTTLRERVVEAVAPQIHANDPAYSPPYWDDCTDDMKRWYRGQATAALDAMLDCLDENADEWWFDAFEPENRQGKVSSALLQVLREDR